MNKFLGVVSLALVILGAFLFMGGILGACAYTMFAVANGETVPAVIAKIENITVISCSTGVGFMMLSMVLAVWRSE